MEITQDLISILFTLIQTWRLYLEPKVPDKNALLLASLLDSLFRHSAYKHLRIHDGGHTASITLFSGVDGYPLEAALTAFLWGLPKPIKL